MRPCYLDISFATSSLRKGLTRELQTYLYVRQKAKNRGGYFRMTPDFMRQMTSDQQMSKSSAWRRLDVLVRMGWLTRLRKGHYHFTSLKKLKSSLGFSSRAVVELENGKYVNTSHRRFKAFLVGCLINKNIVYRNRYGKLLSKCSSFGATRVKPSPNAKAIQKGQFALSLIAQYGNMSKSEASSLRKLAKEMNLLDYHMQINRGFGLFSASQAGLIKEALPELAHKVCRRFCDDLWYCIRETDLTTCKLPIKKRRKPILYTINNNTNNSKPHSAKKNQGCSPTYPSIYGS